LRAVCFCSAVASQGRFGCHPGRPTGRNTRSGSHRVYPGCVGIDPCGPSLTPNLLPRSRKSSACALAAWSAPPAASHSSAMRSRSRPCRSTRMSMYTWSLARTRVRWRSASGGIASRCTPSPFHCTDSLSTFEAKRVRFSIAPNTPGNGRSCSRTLYGCALHGERGRRLKPAATRTSHS